MSRSHAAFLAVALAAGALLPATPRAQTLAEPYTGFLCCNMLSDGSWISDINYRDERKQLVAAGTPVTVTGYGRWRVLIEIDGKKLALGNDYSRKINLEEFARRYVLATDPARQLAGFGAKQREAIQAGKLTRGMTREQVLMAVGYPVASYTADLDAPLWRYWLNRSAEWQVFWGADGRVDKVFGAPEVRAKVSID